MCIVEGGCNCSCHRVPGMVHCFPCCDKPSATDKLKEQWPLTVLQLPFDTNRDPGDESDAPGQE